MTEKAFWKRSSYAHLWIHLIFKASHSGSEFLWNGKIEKLGVGQFLTGRKSLSEETGIPQGSVEDILTFFEKEGQIQQQKQTSLG